MKRATHIFIVLFVWVTSVILTGDYISGITTHNDSFPTIDNGTLIDECDEGGEQNQSVDKSDSDPLLRIKALITSGFQNAEMKKWYSASADITNAIDLYDSLDYEVRAAIEKSDARIIGMLFSQRGLCKYRLKDIEGAENDWKIARKHGYLDNDFVKQAKDELFAREAEDLVSEFQTELNQKADREYETQERRRTAANMAVRNYINDSLNYVTEKLNEYNYKKIEAMRLRIEKENQLKLEAAEAQKKQEAERLRLEYEKQNMAKPQGNTTVNNPYQPINNTPAAGTQPIGTYVYTKAEADAKADADRKAATERKAAADRKAAEDRKAAAAAATVYEARINYITSDYPNGSKYPCNMPGYQIWTQKITISLRNPNNFLVQVEYQVLIYAPGKEPLNFTEFMLIQPGSNREYAYNYEIGCWMYSPGKFASKIVVIKTNRF